MSGSMEYRGKRIRLSKSYSDYDDYKADPDNIARSETKRVQLMVANATLAQSYRSFEEMICAVMELKVPGHGAGRMMGSPQSDGSELHGVMIEIPRSGKFRHIVYRERQGVLHLADDFQAEGKPLLMRVDFRNGEFLYSPLFGEPILSRKPNITA